MQTQEQHQLDIGTLPSRWDTATHVHSPAELHRITRAIEDRMAAAGYPLRAQFGVRLAIEEAVVNAVKHGHKGDTSKAVRVRYRVGLRDVLVEVEDQGAGFDPGQVPDPLAPENLDRSSGRGLLLMRSFLTVRYNERGNRVILYQSRSGS